MRVLNKVDIVQLPYRFVVPLSGLNVNREKGHSVRGKFTRRRRLLSK